MKMAANEVIEVDIDDHDSCFPTKILESMFMNEKTADVRFVFDDGDKRQLIPAHKVVLAVNSCVFNEMFFDPLKDEINEVKMVDIPFDVFQVFLQWFYRSDIEVTTKNVKTLSLLAHKYNVEECSRRCETFLRNTLDESNVFQAYEIALLQERSGLKAFCETLIGLKTKTLFQSDGFRRVGIWLVQRIFGLDSLSCSEFELFEACICQIKKYGAECDIAPDIINLNIRSCFKSFRAGVLSITELSELSKLYSDLFSYDELSEMLQMIASNKFQPKTFSGIRKTRESQIKRWKSMEVTSCNRSLNGGDEHECRFKEIRSKFTTNQSVLLIGLRFSQVHSDCYADLESIFEITERSKSAQHDDGVTLDEGIFDTGACVMFKQPVLIKSEFIYEIALIEANACFLAPECTLSCPELKSQVQIGSDFNVCFHPKDPNADSMCGLVEELLFIKF